MASHERELVIRDSDGTDRKYECCDDGNRTECVQKSDSTSTGLENVVSLGGFTILNDLLDRLPNAKERAQCYPAGS